MIDSTLELITQAASNSLFIFCFCNLIILMIFMGSKPAGSNFEQESEVPAAQTTTWENAKQGRKSMHSLDGSRRRLIEVKEASNVQEEPATDDNKEENSSSDDHEEENDEFRRRVEEFIEKVNREWKAELMRTSRLV
ncbi:hypothetical protein ACOSP7_027264 [Xanthoceras sorbifolium]|uniref:DUF4408 domain-containing protein n=1 Tax=Xanthoceras sorbifolium TaxID=99658 RepID=A0ABQ8HFX1_9ROSI|nr:hypothetical protein JRO89_XS11G0164600 [Xanthoceras sorbifolium]